MVVQALGEAHRRERLLPPLARQGARLVRCVTGLRELEVVGVPAEECVQGGSNGQDARPHEVRAGQTPSGEDLGQQEREEPRGQASDPGENGQGPPLLPLRDLGV